MILAPTAAGYGPCADSSSFDASGSFAPKSVNAEARFLDPRSCNSATLPVSPDTNQVSRLASRVFSGICPTGTTQHPVVAIPPLRTSRGEIQAKHNPGISAPRSGYAVRVPLQGCHVERLGLEGLDRLRDRDGTCQCCIIRNMTEQGRAANVLGVGQGLGTVGRVEDH